MLNDAEKNVIRNFAKQIFTKCRTLANLAYIKNKFELFNVLDIYRKKAHVSGAVDDANKVFLLFCLYIDGVELHKKHLEMKIRQYETMPLSELRDAAKKLELKVCAREGCEPIDDYILEVISIEEINNIIVKREGIAVDAFDEEEFEDAVSLFQKRIKFLRDEIFNSKLYFKPYNNGSNVYVLRCEASLENAMQLLANRIYEEILNLETDIRHLHECSGGKGCSKGNIRINSFDKQDFRLIACKYIELYQQVYCSAYTDNRGNNSVSKSAHKAYLLLEEINDFPNDCLQEVLHIKEIAAFVVRKLFSPAISHAKSYKDEGTSNVNRYMWGQLDEKSAPLILQSFRMPTRKTKRNTTYLWGCIDETTDVVILRERIDTLSFFQNYAQGNNLFLLLKNKLRLHQIYISLVNTEGFLAYYKCVTSEILHGKRCASLPFEDTALIQKYDVKLMDTLLDEKYEREGLRSAYAAAFTM